MNQRPGLDPAGLSTGKKARLHRILYQYGLGNGTAVFLPYDQGLEHGPLTFLGVPGASRVRAREGGRCRHGSLPPAAGMAWGVLPPAPLVRGPLMGTCGLIADS